MPSARDTTRNIPRSTTAVVDHVDGVLCAAT
jgi:hypothetical protein